MVQTITEQIRSHLLSSLGFRTPCKKPSLEELRKTQWSERFEKLMRNRLIMGALRYEDFVDKRRKKPNYDYLKEAERVLKQYRETGNIELLVDLANYCLLEFEFGSREGRHFNPIDDGDHAWIKDVKNAEKN